MVSQTFAKAHHAQILAQRPAQVRWKHWRALLAVAREFAASERAQRYAQHALVLGIGLLSLVAVVW
jgi:hypothetical protein